MANFFGILPSFVRYDSDLPAGAKILYAEITSQIDFKGNFSASNELLADLYSVTPVTISSWLKSLKNKGYIKIAYVGDEGFDGNARVISILPPSKKFKEGIKKCLTPLKEIFKAYDMPIYNDSKNNDIIDNIYHDNIDIYNNNKYHYKKHIGGNKKNLMPSKEFSGIVLKAYDHIVQLFPKRTQPKTEAQKNKWLDCLDKLERLDGYTLQVVYFITKKARNDAFWGENFVSLLKLRQNNKQGIKYIDYFKERFAKNIEPNSKTHE